MRILSTVIVAGVLSVSILGCKTAPTANSSDPSLKIEALTASPSSVPAGSTSLLKARVTGGSAPYDYVWEGSGAVGYLDDIDSICIFSSPSCHSARATITLTVTDANGALVKDSVDLN